MTKNTTMQFWEWVTGTIIAAITMVLGVAAFIGTAVYSRHEGDELHKRVDILEVQERQDLSHMRDQVDSIYRMMIDERNKK